MTTRKTGFTNDIIVNNIKIMLVIFLPTKLRQYRIP